MILERAMEPDTQLEKHDNQHTEKIVVEVKSFVGLSRVADLQQAIGQHVMYKILLGARHTEYTVYVAMPDEVFDELFQDVDGQTLLEQSALKVVTVNIQARRILRWIK